MTEEFLLVQKYFEILDRIPAGAMVLNSDFKVLFWNKIFGRMDKYS
jgi:PAS domain-containing protein